jgi:tripartite-type tricarboxylate transporter receptor subunit TctC
MSKVPYRDPVQPSTDLAEGRIEFYWGAFAIVRPQVQAGKARLVAFSNTMRFPEEPKIPTVAEAGFPELNYDGLVGLFAPRELPPDVRERIGADVMAAAADPAVSARLLTTGQVVSPGNAAQFAAEIDKQRAIVAVIAKELGIKPAVTPQ